jgi:Na+-translocating ferredoxin:NAD+ oxidoreductase RnfE subunit
MSNYLVLPKPAAREPAPWLALVATLVLLGTDSLAHAAMMVVVTTAAVALAHGVERVCEGVHEEIRHCIMLVVAAGLATCSDLLLLAYAYPVYRTLGLLAPAVLAAVFVHTTTPFPANERSSTRYGELMIALLILGIARELVGHASLLHDLEGPVAVSLFAPEMGFFLAALAPGAFIALGILLATSRWLRGLRTSNES